MRATVAGRGLSYRERWRGRVASGTARPRVALQRAREDSAASVVDLHLTVADDGGSAVAIGTVSIDGLVDGAHVDDGRVDLWLPDPETGMKRVRYTLPFFDRDHRRHELIATMFVRPGRAAARERRTIYIRVVAVDDAAVVAAGVLRMSVADVGRRWWTLRTADASWLASVRAYRERTRAELATRLAPVPS